jgi:hypothetical protein
MAKAKSEAASAEKAASGSVIYCGPSLRGGILNQFTVFKGGIPKHLSESIGKCSAIGKLIVPVEKFVEVEDAIRKQGTPENQYYREVTDYVRSVKA